MNPFRTVPRRQLPNSPFSAPQAPAPPAECYALHDQVTHDKYGLGTVIGVEKGVAVLVDFGSHKRRITTPCSKLIKL